jgi:ubiquinone/menaquinone biosynthesis C-methylase UbiE
MDGDERRQAIRAVWDAMAPGWDERHAYLETVARPVTETMLDRADPRRGEVALDVAAGTGVVGLAAAERLGPDGRVIVSDFADAMVDVAQRNADALGLGNVECRVLDAEHLDLDAETIDIVLCRWGYMLMPDPPAAMAESRRVLRPGGRLACAVFAGPEENPWAALPMQVLQERGLASPPAPGTPGILALADRERLHRLLTGSGFGQVAIEDVPFTWPFDDGEGYWRFLTDAAGAVAVLLERLEPDARAEVRADLLGRLGPFESRSGIELPAVAIVATAWAS